MRNNAGIKYRQLQYFLAVAESLHFSKAAESLFVTQSTLSHQLAELESHLGTPLFDRAGKGVQLTQAGQVFREHARASIEAMQAGRAALDELAGLQRGELRIGVTQSFIRRLMPPILGEFRRQYPTIRLQVYDLTAYAIERQLAEGTLDLGIAFAPAALEETELEPILEERLLLVVSCRHPLAVQEQVRLRDLGGVPLALLGREYFTRRMLEERFREAGAELVAACESNSVDLLVGLAIDSDLATIMPESGIQPAANIRVLPIVDPVLVRTTALLWPRHRFKTLAATTFARIVQQSFAARLPAV